jgi:radical SAM superfamily enzyme YgiQ (UPF0313 family)
MREKVNVLIVNPPSPDGYIYIRDICRWGRKSKEGIIWPQVSLAYLAAMVPEGVSVEIIDAIAERMKWQVFKKRIEEKGPQVYVTYVSPPTFKIDAQGIKVAKEIGATTITIGTHPSAVPQDTLERIPELDIVIRHEPELTFREIIERIISKKSFAECLGIALRNEKGEIVINPDRPFLKSLDELPIPRHELLPLDRYSMPFIGRRYTMVLTNRGCPYHCSFCFESVVWGDTVRYRSAESIMKELEYLHRINVKRVVFLADLFTLNRKVIMELCDLIIKRGLPMCWACNSRVDTIDEEMLRKMKQAGCWLIAFGLESGSQKILDRCDKRTTVEKGRQAIEMTQKIGIKSWGYFIIGLPGETKETIRETINFAKSLPLDIALFHLAVPYPGTGFYHEALEKNWLDSFDWSYFDMEDVSVVSYPNLSSKTILNGTRLAFREFYFRPKQFWRLCKMWLSTKGFPYFRSAL